MLLLTPARFSAPADRVSLATPPTFRVPALLQTKNDKPERSRVASEVCPDPLALLRTVTLPRCNSVPPPVKFTLVLLASIPGVLPMVKALAFEWRTPLGIRIV